MQLQVIRKKNEVNPEIRFKGFSNTWKKIPAKAFLKLTLREIAKPTIAYTSLGIKSHFKGTILRHSTDPNKIALDNLFEVNERDLIVNITFAWEGAVALANKNDHGSLVSHRFPTYTFDENLVDYKFFEHYFKNKRFKYLLGVISPGGAGRNRVLNKKDFLNLLWSMPEIDEQEKIADMFQEINKWLENLKSQKVSLGEYKRSMMQKIFSKEIRFKDEVDKNFADWESLELNKIGKSYSGLSGKSGDDFGEGEPFITYKQIFDSSEIDVEKFGKVKNENDKKQNRVQYGDILFTTSSETPSEVGFASVYLNKTVNPYLNSFSFGFRPYSLKKLNPNFAKYLFRSSYYRRMLVKLAQGSTRYNLSKTEFMKLIVEIPSEKEQEKIADFLTAIDNLINSKASQIEHIETWKKGLLQKMFV